MGIVCHVKCSRPLTAARQQTACPSMPNPSRRYQIILFLHSQYFSCGTLWESIKPSESSGCQLQIEMRASCIYAASAHFYARLAEHGPPGERCLTRGPFFRRQGVVLGACWGLGRQRLDRERGPRKTGLLQEAFVMASSPQLLYAQVDFCCNSRAW